MLSASFNYLQALRSRVIHPAFRLDLYDDDGDVLAQDVKILGGSVQARLEQRVTRTAQVTVESEWWPASPTDPLTPYQTIAKIYAGYAYGDGSKELFQLVEGRVGQLVRNANGTVTARIDDRAADVVAFNFESPKNSSRIPVINQIQNLITEVIPGAVFGPHDVSTTQMTPKLTWDESRGDALDTLAGALGARWYQLGNGSFVVRRLPYDVGTPVADIFDGPAGLLIDGEPSFTRDGAANSVTVVVERADGGVPFRVTARDTAATSPTRFDGPFGRVSKIVKVQTALTNGQALSLARSELNAATALSSQWTASCAPDYRLEPADTVRLRSRGVQSTQLIDSITYPLDKRPMGIQTRAYMRPPATVA